MRRRIARLKDSLRIRPEERPWLWLLLTLVLVTLCGLFIWFVIELRRLIAAHP
jgi:hypothetical protein